MTTTDDNPMNMVDVIIPLVTLTIDKLLENLVEVNLELIKRHKDEKKSQNFCYIDTYRYKYRHTYRCTYIHIHIFIYACL